MENLRFKRLTVENWKVADPILLAFVSFSLKDGTIRTLSDDEWTNRVLAVELGERVPLEVRRLFAVARGALVYGYYFYPLYTLGAEQLYRVADTAASHKSRELGLPDTKSGPPSFYRRVEYLVEQGAIPARYQERWHHLREMRNLSSHPEDQSIFLPGMAIEVLHRIAADINRLFQS